MNTRKHWAPDSEVTVDRVDRSGSGGWVVAGTLAVALPLNLRRGAFDVNFCP